LRNSVAILIIGSLIWDRRDHRVSWRQKRLKADSKMPARAPIRYGRLSKDRDETYTMVFANGLPAAQNGWALAVRCRCEVNNANQLVEEARALWQAEQTDPSKPMRFSSSASWGAVGLLCNPARGGSLDAIRAGWRDYVADEHEIYRAFPCAKDELPVVGSDGILQFPWSVTESGDPLTVDLVLATATVPTLRTDGTYATSEMVAREWKLKPKEQRYFDENRRAGITTAFDYDIMKFLLAGAV